MSHSAQLIVVRQGPAGGRRALRLVIDGGLALPDAVTIRSSAGRRADSSSRLPQPVRRRSCTATADEARVGQQAVQAPVEVLASPSAPSRRCKRPRRPAHERVARAPPVGDVQAPAGAQDAHRLGQRRALGVGVEVVQQQRHDDAVGARSRRAAAPSPAPCAIAPRLRPPSRAPARGPPDRRRRRSPRRRAAASAMASVPVPQPTSTTARPGRQSVEDLRAQAPAERRLAHRQRHRRGRRGA